MQQPAIRKDAVAYTRIAADLPMAQADSPEAQPLVSASAQNSRAVAAAAALSVPAPYSETLLRFPDTQTKVGEVAAQTMALVEPPEPALASAEPKKESHSD